eukprot:GFYU01005188.1.p1 GENE.GFYU01005188.1~~GFYU01005188.1.p1  ORF type:complete len:128 (+),score=14.17 GFYU01005188.1:114-497(+)
MSAIRNALTLMYGVKPVASRPVGYAMTAPLASRITMPHGSHRGSRGFASMSSEEERLSNILLENLQPHDTQVYVSDASGGCGTFYQVQVISGAFKGKSKVQQHRMVNEILSEEITNMHGLTIVTKAP